MLTYRRFGGSIQVKIETFADLREAMKMPETQWVATSAPTSTLVADPRFLQLMDTDGNNRVRVDELQAAVAWLDQRLSSVTGVNARSDVLVLDHVKDTLLVDAAVAVLDAVKAADRSCITAAAVRDAQKPLREAGLNGDGIIAERHLPEPLRTLAEKIRRIHPETKNRNGEPGLAPATLQSFVDERKKLLAQKARNSELFVWGDESLQKAQRIEAVRARIEEHFLLCRLVASQPDARERFRLAAGQIEALVGDRKALEKALHSLPIAPPDAAGVLVWSTLHRGPAWEDLTSFADDVAGPLTKDRASLTEGAWRELSRQAALILAWHNELQASPLAPLLDELAAIDSAQLDALKAAQDSDLAAAARLGAIDDLERLVLFQAWILRFANSFMAMPDLYSEKHRALFERGEAILCGRRYVLSVTVPDVGAHKSTTEQGTTCVIYAHVQTKDGTTAFDIAIPKTRGWSTEVTVGKRGIFYDVNDVEYDLVVTHVVRHPVSVIEAALSPFIRLGEVINKKLESLGAGAEASLGQQSDALGAKLNATSAGAMAAASTTASAMTAPPAAVVPPPPLPPKPAAPAPAMGGALAAGGLAFAAVGSSIAFVVSQLKALGFADVVQIVALLFLAVAVPSGFVGWLKLRRRDLAQLLEGAGWALNDRLRMTRSLAAVITRKPARPTGSTVEVVSFAKTREEQEAGTASWVFVVVVGVLLLCAWQLKDPLLRAGCHERAIPEAVCAALQVPIGVDEEPSP